MKPYRTASIYAGLIVAASASIAWAAPEPSAAAADRASAVADLDKLLSAAGNSAEKLDNEQQTLEQILQAAVQPLDKATADLALANWLLAKPTARAATRWLLGMGRSDDTRTLAQWAAKAQTHLVEAEKLLKDQSSGDAGGSKSDLRRLSTRLETLKAFAAVMRALEKDADAKPGPEAWSERALGLSEARESETGPLASAATLWQGAAWVQAGRRERAMTMLPDALTKPDQPFDFLTRLLRCRLLAEAGEYGAAMGLSSRISASVDTWFPRDKPSELAARRRLAGLVQLSIGQEWAAKLKAGTQPADGELLEGVLVKLKKDLFSDNGKDAEVYMLQQSIPILVEPPALVEARNAPEVKPATQTQATTEPAAPAAPKAEEPASEDAKPDSDSKPE